MKKRNDMNMVMKGCTILLVLFLLIVVQAQAKDLSVEIPKTNFDPGLQTLDVVLKNRGEEKVENLTIDISGSENVTILGSSEIFVGELVPGAKKPISFSIYVEQNPEDRSCSLNLSISYEKRWEKFEKDLTLGIFVAGKKADLRINAAPVTMNVGEETEVKIEVVNAGNDLANEVRCSLSSENIDLLSPSTVFLGSLSPGERRCVSYNIISNISGIHNLFFNLTHKNGSESTLINCRVNGGSQLAITGIDVSRNGSVYEITGVIANVGTEEALYVVISAENGIYPYKDYYIGTLEPNDFSTFELHTQGGEKAFVNLNYRDPFGHSIIEERCIEVNGEQREEMQEQNSSLWLYALVAIITILIIAIIIYIWIKGRRQ